MNRSFLARLPALIAVIVIAFFPFYWAINASFQPENRLYQSPADWFPLPGTLAHYKKVFGERDFVLSVRNSAVVAATTTVMALALGSFAACALGRWKPRGRQVVLALILAMTLFPQISVLGALHTTISRIGLYNRLGGLVVSYMLFTLPFTVWTLTTFFAAMPKELEESAVVDGAGPLRTFWSVLLPLAVPGLATTGILAFIGAWNEYLFALSFTITPEARTAPVVIANLSGEGMHEVPWGSIMAASVVVTVPLIIIVLFFQRRIVSGLTAGAVKG